jgi:hypothetical protein
MFKPLMILGLINSSIAVPFIFFNRKRGSPIFYKKKCNKINYINKPITSYNNTLLIKLIKYDICFVCPDMIKYVYKKNNLSLF